MAKSQIKTQKALIQLDKINAKQLVEISKWEKTQKKIVIDNPFVEISNTESYNQAKANRTSLLKGRTSLLGANGQEAVIKTAFKSLLTGSITILKDLANITEPHYTKQQEEVKRYESIIEEKRLERAKKAEEERLDEEHRIQLINDNIDRVYEDHRLQINQITFNNIETTQKAVAGLKELDTSVYEEFEVTYYKTLERLEELLNEKIETLTISENQRLENIKLAEERKKFEEEKAKTREEENQRQEKINAENQKKFDDIAAKQKVIDVANKEKEEKLAKEQAEIQAEKQRLAKIEEDRLEKIRLEKEEKQRIVNQKKEEKRLKALQPDMDKAIEQVESLQITTVNTIKDKLVKVLLNDFISEVDTLKNQYKTAIQNLK